MATVVLQGESAMLLLSISEVSSNANTISQYIYFLIFAYTPKPEKSCYFFGLEFLKFIFV